MRDDLISRKTAIEEMLKCGEYYNGNDEAKRGVAQCIGVIHELPSAQPKIEERKEESAQNVSKEDLVSRKAAIDALDSINCCGYVEEPWDIVRGIIERVPAAEPEKHTEERTETHACDSISRQAAIDALIWKIRLHNNGDGTITMCVMSEELVRKTLDDLPSAQPEIVRCKDCKHWKDSDGVYRRGINAESKCPVNIRAVYEGNFYCADAERRTDE